jgi:acetyl esterase
MILDIKNLRLRAGFIAMSDSPAEPLYRLIRRIRRPAALRHIMAQCLRHVYMGDPFSGDKEAIPAPPDELKEGIAVKEYNVSDIRCVLYTPKEMQVSMPLLLYMHGGGFVVGCSEDTDYATRKLCLDNRCAVVSVNYGLAPENVFPSAVEECLQVLSWATKTDGTIGIPVSQVFLAGDSAGGNLAVSVAIRLKQISTPASGLVLFAPWLDMNVEKYTSYNRLAPEGTIFDAAFIGYARSAYVRFEDWENPFASPIYCDAGDLPPTIIVAGTDDPLFEQSSCFAARAGEEGKKQIELVAYEGMPHCFYSFPGLFEEELDCYKQIAKFLGKLIIR